MQIDDDFDAVIDFSEFLFFCVALDSIKPDHDHGSETTGGAGSGQSEGQGHTAIDVSARSREREKDIAMLSR